MSGRLYHKERCGRCHEWGCVCSDEPSVSDDAKWEYEKWEYCKAENAYLEPGGRWELTPGGGGTVHRAYRRLRYPRYAELDDIPITPGRVEWGGYSCGGHDWRRNIRTSWTGPPSKPQFCDEVSTTKFEQWLDAQIEFICDLFAPAEQTDEQWLRERFGKNDADVWCDESKYTGSVDCDGFDVVVRRKDTREDVWAALRRAVEAIESV